MSARGDRWDRERVVYDREYDREYDRGRDHYDDRREDDRYTMRGGRGRDHSDDRFDRRPYQRSYDDDYVTRERRFHDDDPRLAPRREPMPEQEYSRRVVIDRERDRDREFYRSPSPRRPAFLRRQSSLDTFDRAPIRHFRDREEYPPPARREDIYRDEYRAPAYTPIPLPKQEALPPARRQRFYEDVDVVDDDRYDDRRPFPPEERVREREIVRTRKRRDESRDTHTTRTSRSRTHRSSSRSSATSSPSSSGGTTVHTVKSEYPKKGKTRIPAKLVSKRAIIDLEYPFIEEGNTIIILKALGQENIDDLLKRSDEYKKAEQEVAEARSSAAGLEDRREEVFVPPLPAVIPAPAPPPPPPASVHMAPPPAPAPIIVAAPPAPAPVVIDAAPPRTVSPTTTSTSSWDYHHHHHHDHHDHGGPLVLAERPRSQSRSRREIRAEIKALQQELVSRPKHEVSGRDIVRAERLPDGQLVVYEESIERIETGPKPPRIEKDKKGRMSLSIPKYR
jgi:hypothetical protein